MTTMSFTESLTYPINRLRNASYPAQTEQIPPPIDNNGNISFDPSGDPSNPKSWPTPYRWLISISALLLVTNATFASSSPSAVLPSISEDLHVPTETASVTITIFLITYSFGPLFWAPLSEHYGRRWIFYAAFVGYFAFGFLCAFAPNFGALIVARFLTGLFASSTIANAPGLLVDVWEVEERGVAMGVFAVVVFVGPVVGPVISGWLELTEGWRWAFYVLLWCAAGTLPLLFLIPETFGPKLLLYKARRLRQQHPEFSNIQAPVEASDQTLAGFFKTALLRPWRIFIDPISLACTFYTSLIYALLYMLFAIYPIVFREMRGWNAGLAELPLLGVAIGSLFGGGGVLYMNSWDRKRVAAGHKRVPEDRLPLAMIGGVLFPVAMFWFSWTAQYNSIHWVVPTLAGVLLGASFLLISVAYLNYLTDSYASWAASDMAANSICRSLCGAAAPLFTTYMFDSLTVAGGGSLIAGIGVLLAVVPFIFHRYGAEIRRHSKFCREQG